MAFLLICKCAYCTFCVGIFNSTTNEFFQVPQDDYHVDFCAFGFGFIPNTKQYKLFEVPYEWNQPLNKTNGGIFPPYRFEVCDKGAYLNGVIYWLGKQHEYSVYTLDVETTWLVISPTTRTYNNLMAVFMHLFTSTKQQRRAFKCGRCKRRLMD